MGRLGGALLLSVGLSCAPPGGDDEGRGTTDGSSGSSTGFVLPEGDSTSTGGLDAAETSDSDGGNSGSESTTDTGEPAGCPSGEGPAIRSTPAGDDTLVHNPLDDWPDTLQGVGLYPDAPSLSVVADVAVHYAPAWPLWSNGSAKHRYLVVPQGAVVDSSDPDGFVAPVGTLAFKTFIYDDGVRGCARPVETRVMRKTEDGTWDYAVYGWDPEGQTADLLDIAAPVPIDVVGADGAFEHNVPARIECRACHESALDELLGFSRLQLSEPLADGRQDQLAALQASGVLSTAVAPQLIEHPDPTTRDVLGLFAGNCVHCHNGSLGPSSSFDLRPDVALANTIDQPTQSSASASGIRIVAGSPQTSILFLAFSGETDDPEVSAMPPMGVDVRDAAAIEVLRTFILELEP